MSQRCHLEIDFFDIHSSVTREVTGTSSNVYSLISTIDGSALLEVGELKTSS